MTKLDGIFTEIQNILQSNSVFRDLLSRDSQELLLANSLVRPLDTGEVLCHQNMTSQSMYLIISGELDISILADETVVPLAKRYTGDLIGEISALFAMPHIATVSATQPSIVLEIPTEIFKGIITENHDLHNAILARCKNRIIDTALRHVPAFRILNETEFNELSYLASITTARKGDILIQEGDNDYSIYVICKGAVRVFTRVNGVEVTVALRRPGEFFGEYSYLTGQPRTASVSALTDMQLVKLEGEALQSFMEYNEPTESTIKQTATQRKSTLDELREAKIVEEKQIAVSRMERIKRMLKPSL